MRSIERLSRTPANVLGRLFEIEVLNPGLFLLIFVLLALQFKFKLKKIEEQMLCSGFEPGAIGWQAQTDPLSYWGRARNKKVFEVYFKEMDRELMSLTNFRKALLCYAEIKHSDWLEIVMGLGTANQSS